MRACAGNPASRTTSGFRQPRDDRARGASYADRAAVAARGRRRALRRVGLLGLPPARARHDVRRAGQVATHAAASASAARSCFTPVLWGCSGTKLILAHLQKPEGSALILAAARRAGDRRPPARPRPPRFKEQNMRTIRERLRLHLRREDPRLSRRTALPVFAGDRSVKSARSRSRSRRAASRRPTPHQGSPELLLREGAFPATLGA